MNESHEKFEAHSAALNAHLEEIKPIMDGFCVRHGFVYVDKRALGRYPRLHIERVADTKDLV